MGLPVHRDWQEASNRVADDNGLSADQGLIDELTQVLTADRRWHRPY